MKVENAKQEFEAFAAGRGPHWSAYVPAHAIETMVDFYLSVRADGCELENDGDAPTKVDAFLKSIQTILAYKNAAQRSDGKVKLEFENAE